VESRSVSIQETEVKQYILTSIFYPLRHFF
jgi:hypothetical protein